MSQRILVIKLAPLSDLVLSIRAFQALRAHHSNARITLMTCHPFVDLAYASGCFDEIWVDDMAPLWQPWAWWRLMRELHKAGFDRVYDLQRNGRSRSYRRLFGSKKPEWIGQAPKNLHLLERDATQLESAGVPIQGAADLSFLKANLQQLQLPKPYALLVPGGSADQTAKRWPAPQYAKLAASLAQMGIHPFLIGDKHEWKTLNFIEQSCPQCLNLGGDTSLEDLATLARDARFSVGNDTGPLYLIAAAGCPSLALFSGFSEPDKRSPRGQQVRILQSDDLADLPVRQVMAELRGHFGL